MSYEPDDYAEVYDKRVVRARKEHRCDACRLTIRVGDHYTRTFKVYEGEIDTVKRCGRCETIFRHLERLGYKAGTYPEERLDCGEDYEEEWGGPPPEEIQAMVFATADEASELLASLRV